MENYDHLQRYLGMVNEEDLWKYLPKKHPKAAKMVDKLSETLNYDPLAAMAFCLELLQKVNLENVAADIKRVFDKEAKKV